MTARIKKAFPFFELTIIVALLLIGWVAFGLREIMPDADQRRKQLAELQKDNFRIAHVVQSSISELNSAFTNYIQSKDALEMERFQHRSKDFREWLEREHRRWSLLVEPAVETGPTSTNQLLIGTNVPPQVPNQMLPLLSSIETAFNGFQRASLYLMTNAGGPWLKERLALRVQSLQRSRSRLFTLARQAQLRGEATQWFLADSEKGFGVMRSRFQQLKFALLLALVGLSFLLMLAIYRRRMAQTGQIIQQQKRHQFDQQARLDKLAHFGRLAQEVVHEIKQPLTAITARAYTLEKLLPPGTDTHKDAGIIRTEIKRLDYIVKDFLEQARPADPKRIPVAVESVLEEIRDLMGCQLDGEAIALKCECKAGVEVIADTQQLKQVLINLVKNAAESLDHSGTITLCSRKARLPLRGEQREVAVIEVEDTGPGIAPEIHQRIFDPFFSTKAHGTGLGLAIASGIVDKHGGTLEFETKLGHGTVFRIILPAAEQSQMHEQNSAH